MKLSGWTIATIIPFVILALLVILAIYDYYAGSNLWPILIVLYVPIAAAYLAILGIARWIVARRAQKQSA